MPPGDPPGLDDGYGPAGPLRSALVVLGALLDGRLRRPPGRVGKVLAAGGGQRFVVYRETTLDPPDERGESGNPGRSASAVLSFRFHLRFMPRPVRPIAARVFEPLSVLTTPFFAGLDGFRTKLWLSDRSTGDYMGVYEWDSADGAERYARSLRRLMDRLSVPGSVAYEVVDGATLDDYVRRHARPPEAGGAAMGPAD